MWSVVAKESDLQGLTIWNTPTKLHYLHHLGEKAMFLNPRKGNTMVEETYMGVCKTLAKSCLNSTDGVNMPKAFMDNIFGLSTSCLFMVRRSIQMPAEFILG